MSTALKIPKDTFVKALTERLARAEKAAAERVKYNNAYTKALNEFCMTHLKSAIKSNTNLTMHQQYGGDIQVTLTGCPRFEFYPFEQNDDELGHWAQDEIVRAIKLIQMSESEYVPASLHKNVASYI